MKKKRIIFIIVLLSMLSICTFSYASSEFTCIFTLINPSATNVAFGLESGTANIWDRNPLGVWSNPAKLGYYKGFSYGYSHDKWFEGVVEDMYHNSSYITFGWNGLGFLLPFKNKYKKYGATMYYGEQEAYDAHGNFLRNFNSYETCSQFAVGLNFFEFTNKVFKYSSPIIDLQRYSEISLGYSLDYIVSGLCPLIPELMDAEGKGESTSHNIGGIIRISPIILLNDILQNILHYGFSINNYVSLDLSHGINFINIYRDEILYENSNNKQPLPNGIRNGVAGKLSFINIKNLADEYPLLYDISKYLFSIYASYDNSKYGDNPSTWGKGIELTFLDIFSWRSGEYNDIDGHIVGDCKGWGVNLNYKDVVSFQYNYVEFPGGDLQKTQEKEDISFSIDIIKLINELK